MTSSILLPSKPEGEKPRTKEENAGSASFTLFCLFNLSSFFTLTHLSLLIQKQETREGAVGPKSEMARVSILLPGSQARQREAASLLAPNLSHKCLSALAPSLIWEVEVKDCKLVKVTSWAGNCRPGSNLSTKPPIHSPPRTCSAIIVKIPKGMKVQTWKRASASESMDVIVPSGPMEM